MLNVDDCISANTSFLFSLNEVLNPSSKDFFDDFDGLVRHFIGVSLLRLDFFALGFSELLCTNPETLAGLCLSFNLFDTRTDLEVFVLPKLDEVDAGVGFMNSLSLWTADG